MKIPRIKLQWGTAKQQPGNWYLGLLGFYERKSGGRTRGLAISVRGLLLWGMVAAAGAYCAVAGYVVWRLDQRPYNFVRYSDMLLYPIRKHEIERLRGQASIAEGFDQLKAGNWRGGVMLLRIGLEKNPRDLKARLEVARFFIAAKLRDKAQETLFQGLAYGYPGRAYLDAAFGVVSAGEDYELVVELCDRALALHGEGSHSATDGRWLKEQRIRALLAAQRADEALAYAEQQVGEIPDSVLSELRLLALLQAERVEDALKFVAEWRGRAGDTAQVIRLQARVQREAGKLEEMSATLADLRRRNPADARARVFSFVQTLMAGLEADGRAQIDDYIFRFGGTPENFVLAVEPLAEIKRLAEVDMLIAAATERGIRDPRLAAARLQALVGARRWSEATIQLDALRSKLTPDEVARATMLEFMQVLIGAASDPAEGAQANLTDYLAVRQFPISAYRQSIDVLRSAGRTNTARDVVRLAEGVFPANRYLGKVRGELDAEIEAARLAAEAERGVRVVVSAFLSSKAFYAELDRVRAEEGREAALALIRELRQTAPVWMTSETEKLDRAELDLHAAGDDLVMLQAAARRYANPDRVRIQGLIAVATQLFEAGRKREAGMVLDELLRRVPEQPAAVLLKTRWFPPPPPPEEKAASDAAAAPAPAVTPP
ncbi:MAG: hypothetical protein MUE42_06915 [Opitutaceae bacterium]|jgi:tetratricopeptide (TPR) repeat protein|nr:hypothetical protein [Opitutaceae bacterium]